MSQDFINDLINSVNRVARPDVRQLKEILILCGMPAETKNIRYLSFNHHIGIQGDRTHIFSAVAVLNNRRISHFRLKGNRKKISRIIFNKKWTFNPLDFFLNRLRCDSGMTDIMAASVSDYTLLGILKQENISGKGYYRHKYVETNPVVAIPGISDWDLKRVIDFEKANHIRKVTLKNFTIYRQTS
ncbi:hypothetical protein QUF90_04615 [Desulfococcaceae bacterium HSG9]|nr:hypothetical protein [Desulfococcaceae bacterium HSG9]